MQEHFLLLILNPMCFFFVHTGVPGSPNSPEVANGLFRYDERHLVLRRCRIIGIVDYKAACSAPE